MIEVQFRNSVDLYPNSDWVEGRFYNRGRNYRFQAKVNATNSEVYGICGGRFIKFWVQNTDNGKVVLKYMQECGTPMLKARDIAEGLFISSRGVGGALRKLVTDGFCEKVGQDPVIYALTEKGKNYVIENEGENN